MECGVASASRDGTAKVWDLETGREIATYRGHLNQPDDPTRGGSMDGSGGTDVFRVADVAFHPKDKVVASAAGNQVHLWDPATGKAIKTLLNIGKTEKPLKAIAFSPDGKFLAVAGDDGILRVIESDTGKEKYKSPSRNARLERVAWSPNGNMVVVGDGNQQVAVYAPNLPNQLAMAVQGVDLGSVVGVAFTADNKEVLTCGGDGKIHLTWGPKPDGTSAGNTASRDGEFVGHVARPPRWPWCLQTASISFPEGSIRVCALGSCVEEANALLPRASDAGDRRGRPRRWRPNRQ